MPGLSKIKDNALNILTDVIDQAYAQGGQDAGETSVSSGTFVGFVISVAGRNGQRTLLPTRFSRSTPQIFDTQKEAEETVKRMTARSPRSAPQVKELREHP